MFLLHLRSKTYTRIFAEPQTQKRQRAPPPPPPPPSPPPWMRPEGRRKRKDELSRRDTIALSFTSVGVCIGFLLAKNAVTGKIDQDPNALRTRFKRNEKGQPFVQASDGDWMLLRTSPVTAGMILLRDRIGRVFRLQVINRLQVDLADDKVVMELFGDGKWESTIEQLLDRNEKEVVMTEEKFLKLEI